MTDRESKVGDIYSHIGYRIKQRRKELGISQTAISDMLGISYQQVQKYEGGLNQISIARLLQFARTLNVPPEYFYEGASFDETIGQRIETDIIEKVRPHAFSILLVEDSPSDALLFERAVKKFSQSVVLTCISDTEKIMEAVVKGRGMHQERSPDIVLLDINLPKVTGLQVLKKIKENSQCGDMPVIMLTNSISKKEMVESYRLGANGFMQKSVDFAEFEDNVETLINYWLKVMRLPIRG